jgi:N-acetylneuraminic acid mutarotase
MSKSLTLLIVLVFLTASCLVVAKTAFSSADIVEDSWITKTPMREARGDLGVAVVNGKIYAIGGSTASGNYPPSIPHGGFVGTNEEYDPATDKWTFKESMPTPRADFAIAVYQNKIYCIGGAIGVEKQDYIFYSFITSGVNEVYDPATDTWETKTPMPTGGSRLHANVVNGKIYVIKDSSGRNEVYDPATDSWTTKAKMPIPTGAVYSYPDDYVSAVVDNKIYILGEFLSSDVFSVRLLIYDTENDSWGQGAPALSTCWRGSAGATTGVLVPKRIYVISTGSYSNQVYDPKSDGWTAGAAIPTSRLDFGVAVVNDKLYAIGGYTSIKGDFAPSAVNEQYTPFGYGTIPPVISVVSPVNQTYNVTSVSLVFTVNKPVVWLGYSLDGLDNVTITGNTTISGLSNGLHNVTVYAKDEFENTGVSETISFSVEVPFPVIPVAVASAATIAVVGVVLLVYFKKRKH